MQLQVVALPAGHRATQAYSLWQVMGTRCRAAIGSAQWVRWQFWQAAECSLRHSVRRSQGVAQWNVSEATTATVRTMAGWIGAMVKGVA